MIFVINIVINSYVSELKTLINEPIHNISSYLFLDFKFMFHVCVCVCKRNNL